MKRFLLFALVLMLTGAAAVFAEVNFSGSGTTTIVPFGVRLGDETETVVGNSARWSAAGPRLQLVGAAQNEAGTMGAQAQINADAGGFGLDENAKVWFKPFDWLKVTMGKFKEDYLRFKIGVTGGGFHNDILYIRGDNLDESAFLGRFAADSGYGTHLALTPVEGLYIGAALGSTFNKRAFQELREDGAQDVFSNAQFGVGYTIKDIGFARLLYNGAVPTGEDGKATGIVAVGDGAARDKAPTIQAAFQLTAVKGLNLDIGGQIPVSTYEYKESGTDTTVQYPYIVGVGFDFTAVAPFRFYGRVSYKTGGYAEATAGSTTVKVKDGDNLAFIFTPMYTIADGWILGLDLAIALQSGSDLSPIPDGSPTGARGGDVDKQYIAYWDDPTRAEKKADLKNNYLDLGFGPYLRHNFKGGDVRFGVTAKVPGGEAHEGASVQVFVPIILNYNF